MEGAGRDTGQTIDESVASILEYLHSNDERDGRGESQSPNPDGNMHGHWLWSNEGAASHSEERHTRAAREPPSTDGIFHPVLLQRVGNSKSTQPLVDKIIPGRKDGVGLEASTADTPIVTSVSRTLPSPPDEPTNPDMLQMILPVPTSLQTSHVNFPRRESKYGISNLHPPATFSRSFYQPQMIHSPWTHPRPRQTEIREFQTPELSTMTRSSSVPGCVRKNNPQIARNYPSHIPSSKVNPTWISHNLAAAPSASIPIDGTSVQARLDNYPVSHRQGRVIQTPGFVQSPFGGIQGNRPYQDIPQLGSVVPSERRTLPDTNQQGRVESVPIPYRNIYNSGNIRQQHLPADTANVNVGYVPKISQEKFVQNPTNSNFAVCARYPTSDNLKSNYVFIERNKSERERPVSRLSFPAANNQMQQTAVLPMPGNCIPVSTINSEPARLDAPDKCRNVADNQMQGNNILPLPGNCIPVKMMTSTQTPIKLAAPDKCVKAADNVPTDKVDKGYLRQDKDGDNSQKTGGQPTPARSDTEDTSNSTMAVGVKSHLLNPEHITCMPVVDNSLQHEGDVQINQKNRPISRLSFPPVNAIQGHSEFPQPVNCVPLPMVSLQNTTMPDEYLQCGDLTKDILLPFVDREDYKGQKSEPISGKQAPERPDMKVITNSRLDEEYMSRVMFNANQAVSFGVPNPKNCELMGSNTCKYSGNKQDHVLESRSDILYNPELSRPFMVPNPKNCEFIGSSTHRYKENTGKQGIDVEGESSVLFNLDMSVSSVPNPKNCELMDSNTCKYEDSSRETKEKSQNLEHAHTKENISIEVKSGLIREIEDRPNTRISFPQTRGEEVPTVTGPSPQLIYPGRGDSSIVLVSKPGVREVNGANTSTTDTNNTLEKTRKTSILENLLQNSLPAGSSTKDIELSPSPEEETLEIVRESSSGMEKVASSHPVSSSVESCSQGMEMSPKEEELKKNRESNSEMERIATLVDDRSEGTADLPFHKEEKQNKKSPIPKETSTKRKRETSVEEETSQNKKKKTLRLPEIHRRLFEKFCRMRKNKETAVGEAKVWNGNKNSDEPTGKIETECMYCNKKEYVEVKLEWPKHVYLIKRCSECENQPKYTNAEGKPITWKHYMYCNRLSTSVAAREERKTEEDGTKSPAESSPHSEKKGAQKENGTRVAKKESKPGKDCKSGVEDTIKGSRVLRSGMQLRSTSYSRNSRREESMGDSGEVRGASASICGPGLKCRLPDEPESTGKEELSDDDDDDPNDNYSNPEINTDINVNTPTSDNNPTQDLEASDSDTIIDEDEPSLVASQNDDSGSCEVSEQNPLDGGPLCKCSFCGYSPNTFKELMVHRWFEHEDRDCQPCESTFIMPEQLHSHMKIHALVDAKYCGLCGSKVTSLIEHLWFEHGVRKCLICRKDACKHYSRCPRLMAHMNAHVKIITLETDLECPQCDCGFSTKRVDMLLQHMWIFHLEKKCPFCQFPSVFDTLDNLLRHVSKNHSISNPAELLVGNGLRRAQKLPYIKWNNLTELESSGQTCDICYMELEDMNSLIKHKWLIHDLSSTQICGRQFLFPQQVETWLSIEKLKKGECWVCGSRIGRQDLSILAQHLRVFHSSKLCLLCFKEVKNSKDFMSHLHRHQDVELGVLDCPWIDCGQGFDSVYGLIVHMADRHREKNCLFCDTSCNFTMHLWNHTLMHHCSQVVDNDKAKMYLMGSEYEKCAFDNRCLLCPYVAPTVEVTYFHMWDEHGARFCPVCGVWPKSHIKEYFLEHVLNHLDSENTCILCKGSDLKPKLDRSHLSSAHGVHFLRFLQCRYCEKKFACFTGGMRHRNCVSSDDDAGIHAKICEICGESCTNQAQYLRHKNNRHREKNFLCEECGLSFYSKRVKEEHMRSHNGEKPFKCKVCGTGFARSDYLHAHMRSHTGEKPYLCEHCGKGFTKGNNLTTHVKSMHKLEGKKSGLNKVRK